VLAWAVYDRITLNTAAIRGDWRFRRRIEERHRAVVVGIILYLALGFVFHPVVVGRHVSAHPHLEPDM